MINNLYPSLNYDEMLAVRRQKQNIIIKNHTFDILSCILGFLKIKLNSENIRDGKKIS
jgi:hypothetical protein